MRARLHRGGYDESMATTKNVEPTIESLAAFFAAECPFGTFDATEIEVMKYGPPSDHRNGWDTHIVTGYIGGMFHRAVLGYTDGPLPRTLPKVCGRVLSMVEVLAGRAKVISKRRLEQCLAVPGYAYRLKMPMAPGKSYRLVRIKSLRAAQFDTKPVLLISDDSVRTLQIKAYVKEQGWDKFLSSTELGEVVPFTEALLEPAGLKGMQEKTIYVKLSGIIAQAELIGRLL